MPAETFAALKESIAELGLLVPIVRYEGKLLDGRNRWRACEELGAPALLFKDFTGTRDQAVLVKALNLDRRNLTPEQERAARADLVREMRSTGMSTRAIADAVGVSDTTVVRDLNRGASCEAPEPEQESDPCPTRSSAPSSRASAPTLRPETVKGRLLVFVGLELVSADAKRFGELEDGCPERVAFASFKARQRTCRHVGLLGQLRLS
jgi:ParB-like chromosome segregation protein Spo0J